MLQWRMIASSSEISVAQTLSEVASKREVLMTAIEETLGFPFSAHFAPLTASAATVISLAVVIQGIRQENDSSRTARKPDNFGACQDAVQRTLTPKPLQSQFGP
jgi:hypothetical protein